VCRVGNVKTTHVYLDPARCSSSVPVLVQASIRLRDMNGVSAADENALRRDIDAALASFPSLRAPDWQGENARGGPELAFGSRQPSTLSPTGQALTGGGVSPQNVHANYWQQLAAISSPQIAASVQRWLVLYVKGLSLMDINQIAGGE
jgi:hypothetical protein